MNEHLAPLRINGKEIVIDSYPNRALTAEECAEHGRWIAEVRTRWSNSSLDLSWRCGRLWMGILYNSSAAYESKLWTDLTPEERARPGKQSAYLGLPLTVDLLMPPDQIELQLLRDEDLRSIDDKIRNRDLMGVPENTPMTMQQKSEFLKFARSQSKEKQEQFGLNDPRNAPMIAEIDAYDEKLLRDSVDSWKS